MNPSPCGRSPEVKNGTLQISGQDWGLRLGSVSQQNHARHRNSHNPVCSPGAFFHVFAIFLVLCFVFWGEEWRHTLQVPATCALAESRVLCFGLASRPEHPPNRRVVPTNSR